MWASKVITTTCSGIAGKVKKAGKETANSNGIRKHQQRKMKILDPILALFNCLQAGN